MNYLSKTQINYDEKFLTICNLTNIVENKMNAVGYAKSIEEVVKLVNDSKNILEKILNDKNLK